MHDKPDNGLHGGNAKIGAGCVGAEDDSAGREQQTIAEFVSAAGLSMTAESVIDNPHMDGAESMDNWKCLLRAGRSRMTVYFSKGGVGHKGAAPELAEVLDCLASDAAGVENNGFEDWCSEYGFDTDSRKAERIFKTCERQAAKLRTLLGDSAYETLLWKVSR